MSTASKKNVKPKEPRRLPHKRRSRELSTQKLFEAGVEVFAKHGFDAATTKKVAKCAGMNEALIGRYFKGKAGLLNAIIMDFLKGRRAQAMNYPAGLTLEEEVRNLLSFRFNRVQSNRDFLRIVFSRIAIDGKLRRDLANEITIEPDPLFVERLQALQAKGEIGASQDLYLVAYALSFQVLGLIFWHSTCPSDEVTRVQESIEVFAQAFARGIRG